MSRAVMGLLVVALFCALLAACAKSEAVAFDPNKSSVPGGVIGQQVSIVPMSDGTTCYVAHSGNASHDIGISCLPRVAP